MSADLLSGIWRATRLPELQPRDWESLLGQARRARLAPRLARLCQERGWWEAIPPRPRRHLENALKQGSRQCDVAIWEADRIQRALAHLAGPVVLLKGAAYVVAGLPNRIGRLFTDVDVLVPKSQLRDAERALFAAGWIPARLDPYDERYYRDWMHEVPPMQHVERQTSLDLHHTITPPTSRFAVDAASLLSHSRPVEACHGLAVLAPCDMVLHGVAHLLQDGDFSGGLRDLLDFDELVRHLSVDPRFWLDLVRRAEQLRLQHPLYYAVEQARRLFELQPPAETVAALDASRPGRLRRAAMTRLLSIALRPDHPDCDGPFTGLARWMLYVRSHWLRMPWQQILPHLARKARMRQTASTQAAMPDRAQGPPAL